MSSTLEQINRDFANNPQELIEWAFSQGERPICTTNFRPFEAVILHMPLIRSEIVNFLTEKNFLELQTQEGKELVRQGIVVLVNNILESYEISPGIESALITNFVLQ